VSTPSPQVVISEFRTRGPSGANDEFIELYNSGESPIDVSGWKIRGSNNAAAVTTRLTINNGTTIPARGHFLTTNSSATGYSGNVTGDQTYTSGITNDGGIAITLPDDSIIDQVGLSSGSAFKEGTNLAPLPSDANQSYERKPGGSSGSTLDTGNNFSDFQIIASEPQNLHSNPTPGASPSPAPTPSVSPSPDGSPLPSPSPSPDQTPSPSPSPAPLAKVAISQVFGGGGNAGAPFRNDFIEIFNSGQTSVDLSGWSVQYASATGTNWSVTNLTAVVLLPGHYYLIQEASGGAAGASLPGAEVIGTTAMAAGAGKVALVNNTTALNGSGCPPGVAVVDFVGYGVTADCFEGAGRAPAPGNLTADIRAVNGCTDTNNNSADFNAAAPTPRNTFSTTNQCPEPVALASIATGPRMPWTLLGRQLLRILLSV
jgi:predicted extracellular nuclease